MADEDTVRVPVVGRRVGLRGSVSSAELKVFKRLERREVLYPVKRAPHSRELSAAITAIVEAKKR